MAYIYSYGDLFYNPTRVITIPLTFKDYKINTKDDPYSIMVKSFREGVRKKIVDLLITTKKMEEDKAVDFADLILLSNPGRKYDIEQEIQKCYNDGFTKEECAKNILDKYYKITKINFSKDPINYEEITESVQTEERVVSSSLFWNFINRLNNINVKFILDTKYIKGLENSLNNNDYSFYIETNKINTTEAEHEFRYSKALSGVISSIELYKESFNDISFYVGIDKQSRINFGYVIGNKRIKIGTFKYNTNDIVKLSSIIIPNDKDVDIKILSKRFLSTLILTQHYKNIFAEHLQSYDDDVIIYTSIMNNKFAVVVESLDDEIVNRTYLENMIKENIFKRLPFKYKWALNTDRINNKVYFYFTLE